MTAVFLDLDGTLVDSRPGIVAALSYAFTRSGRPDLADTDMTWMLGPPLIDTFKKLGFSSPEEVIKDYRAYYIPTGMYEAEVYEGIVDALTQMREGGMRLYLATAKPHAYATKVTAHFGLAPMMVREFGPELDGTRNWKGDLLKHALELTGEDPENAVMVGDRHHDMAAAESVGMASIAARWGYGQEEEWKTARNVIDHPSSLPDAIASLGL